MRAYSRLVRHPGNLSLFRAIELSLVATLAGLPLHLHVEGSRGTGKTTILRAARGVLPKLRRIAGCAYNCDPDAPHCPEHSGQGPGDGFRSELIPVPFLEISHSAKVGTVAGSIDLGRLTDQRGPEACLLPGTLARAHRGIVLVDEINRLADTSPELTDLLLDAMGTRPGRLQIEEVGLPPVELPLSVTVWAASNPDEDPGPLEDIRRQLSDRFDLQVATNRLLGREVLLDFLASGHEDLDHRLQGEAPGRGSATPAAGSCRFGETLLARADGMRRPGGVEAPVRSALAELYFECGLESLRSMEAVQIAARAACALRRGEAVSVLDLRHAVQLVLGRRVEPEAIGRWLARPGQAATGRALSDPPAGRAGGDQERPAKPASPAAAGDPGGAGLPGPAAAAGEGRAWDHSSLPQAVAVPDRQSWWGRLLWPGAAGRSGGPGSAGSGPAGGRDTSGPVQGEAGSLPAAAPPRRARPIADIPASEVMRLGPDDGPAPW